MSKIKIKVSGNYEYFFRELLRLNINVYYIDRKYKELIFIIDSSNLNKVFSIKTSCKVNVCSIYGFLKYKNLLCKYKYVFIFFLVSLFTLFYVSNMVLKIDVYGTNTYINKRLYNYLNKYKYSLFLNYNDKNKLRDKILSSNKDLSYIEFNRYGTSVKVYYKENINYKNNVNNRPRDIVAKRDAIVLKIKCDRGEVITYKYAYVRKGDILISGTIMNKDDVLNKVSSSGKVIGEVWYKVRVDIPKNYKSENLVNLNKKGLFINFLDNKFYFNKNITSLNNKSVISNSLFPIYIGYGDLYSVKRKSKKYDYKSSMKKLNSIIYSRFNKKEIISKKVLKKYDYNSKIVYEVFIRKKSDITSYKYIE